MISRRKLLSIVLTVVALALAICSVVAQQATNSNSQEGNSTDRPCVLVYGAVRSPARFELGRPIRLSEAIGLAGGVTGNSSTDVQVLHTRILSCNGEPKSVLLERCIDCHQTSRPISQVDSIPRLYKLSELVGEDEKSNPYLQSGDVVNVLEGPVIYVVGNVVSPQGILLVPGMTLTKAIERAGGTRRHSTKKIRVIRSRPNTAETIEIIIDWEKIKKRRAEDVVLEPYDIVEVPLKGGHGHPTGGGRVVRFEPELPVRRVN